MALAGDRVQVLVGGYELTGDSNRILPSDDRTMYDVTSFGDGVHRFIPGKRRSMLEHSGYMNSAAAASHPVLNGLAVNGVVSVVLGQNAAPTSGDPTYSLTVQQEKYAVQSEVAKSVPFNATFQPRGQQGGWGVALAAVVSFTTTTSGTSVDNGAATTGGGAAFLHILQAAAADTYTIVVEGSTTGAFAGEQTTLATFTLNASALNSERVAIAGTVPRYTRWKATTVGSAGNTVKIAVSLVRF